MLVLSRRAPDGERFPADADLESVVIIDTDKLLLLLERAGVKVVGSKPADLLALVRDGIPPETLAPMIKRCTMSVSVVQVRGGRTVKLGFDAPKTTMLTRSELILELADAFQRADMPIASLVRRPWYVAPLFGIALWILGGGRTSRDGDPHRGLVAG